jgi:uncharacterized protein YgbK (DUF1537 family)
MLSIDDLGILADDLSGACNVASCFVHNCGTVRVRVHLDLPGEGGAGIEVLNSQSRSLPAGACKASARRAGRQLQDKPLIFMKIDTALRGSVGAEIEGLIEAVGEREVFVAPAIPGIGRTTVGGTQYDRGVPIAQTAYAADPISPIRSSRVLDIIRATGNANVRVCDASSDRDLDGVVDLALASPRVLLVGSLGLADALARRLPAVGGPPEAVHGSGPVVIVCGSQYPRALEQIEKAARDLSIPLIALDPYASPTAGGELHGVRAVIYRVCEAPASPGGSGPGEILEGFISRVAPILESVSPRGVGIVGGDTAFELMMRCGVTALEIEGRVAEVVACGRIRDGFLAGCSFAVKGGSVGDEGAVVYMVACLEGEVTGNV